MTYERTFRVELEKNVRMVRTYPKQFDRRFEYYFHRFNDESAWMPWEDGIEPTEHVLAFAEKAFEGEVIERQFHANQTTLAEFGGGGAEGDSATEANATSEAAGAD